MLKNNKWFFRITRRRGTYVQYVARNVHAIFFGNILTQYSRLDWKRTFRIMYWPVYYPNFIKNINNNIRWHFGIKKLRFVEKNYEIHNQKFSPSFRTSDIVVIILKNQIHSIEMLTNRTNFKCFINVPNFNGRKTR